MDCDPAPAAGSWPEPEEVDYEPMDWASDEKVLASQPS